MIYERWTIKNEQRFSWVVTPKPADPLSACRRTASIIIPLACIAVPQVVPLSCIAPTSLFHPYVPGHSMPRPCMQHNEDDVGATHATPTHAHLSCFRSAAARIVPQYDMTMPTCRQRVICGP